MSIAGTRSAQGDEYQLRVAVHWAIRLLTDDDIDTFQVESTGLPGEEIRVHVDDVVVSFTSGRRIYIQAKKNQADYSAWTLGDRTLQEELIKSRDQLEGDPAAEVWFYSRTPFGDLQKLVENSKAFPDYPAFVAGTPANIRALLLRFATIVERDEFTAFRFLVRISFGPAHSYDEWDRQNLADLARSIPQPALARDTLERFLSSHQANLRGAAFLLRKEDIVAALAEKGLYPAPPYDHIETITAFERASAIGRSWIRTIAGQHFERPEVAEMVRAVTEGLGSILLTDRPGGGKTCALLDFADYTESQSEWILLFIKADLFAEAASEADLVDQGLPDDIVGRCARVADERHVLVVVDSLDVLSLHRSQGSLRLFLSLIDRLQTISGVTVVAACRDFDLQYDPLLRGRTWNRVIKLAPLDFNTHVVPLLTQWQIPLDHVTDELRSLLEIPQHLRVFEKLLPSLMGNLNAVTSVYHLYERYLHEVVTVDPLLGAAAMGLVSAMAEHLVQRRSLTISKPTLIGLAAAPSDYDRERIVQRLISQEVLAEPRPGTLSFSHQTLLDCLAVHGALSRGETLLHFIRARLPVPFIRPTVRVFFFYLRAHEPAEFLQQVWAVLRDEDLAYHLRRLIAESLSEIVPTAQDWSLLRRLLRNYPDLFRRLLWRTIGDAWFSMLTSHVLPLVREDPDLAREWLTQVVLHLRRWIATHPDDVVMVWQRILFDLPTESPEHRHIAWNVLNSLKEVEHWDHVGLRDLVELLQDSGDRYPVGRVLASMIRALNSGDELLWKFLTSGKRSAEDSEYDPSDDGVGLGPIQFKRHELPDGFLGERLIASDWLLTRFMEIFAPQDETDQEGPESILAVASRARLSLIDSSYRRHRYPGMVMPYGLEHYLLDLLEEALKERARRNDEWWREHEPALRPHGDLLVRYLLIQAYLVSPEANVTGISVQLCDHDLLSWGDLHYEIGELAKASFPYLSAQTQEMYQRLVMDLFTPDAANGDQRKFRAQISYEMLQWVPSIFRLPAAQAFIDSWEPLFGSAPPRRQVLAGGGHVFPPLSAEQLIRISPEGIVRLAKFYNGLIGTQFTDYGMEGGRDSVQRVFAAAAELDPVKMLGIVETLKGIDVDDGYVQEIVNGVSNHLRYRFGRLNPGSGWTPEEPLPDGDRLATQLLQLLERESSIWASWWTASHAAEACCDVLLDEESASRLIFVLFRLGRMDQGGLRSPEDEAGESTRENDLLSVSINRAKGIAAGAAVRLLNRLIENERAIPELLIPLVHRFARDPDPSTRVGVLIHLPYTVHARPEIGWTLFEITFRHDSAMPNAIPPKLWRYTENVLYYQYREHYGRVGPLLERLRNEAPVDAAETYGRLLTLACLAGHVPMHDVLTELRRSADTAWKGAAQVLCTNVKSSTYRATCISGLLQLLAEEPVPGEALGHIAHAFSDREPGSYLTSEVALAFLRTLIREGASAPTREFVLSGIVEWLAHKAGRDPLSILPVIELLTTIVGRDIHPGEKLAATLAALLREADEVDDPDLLVRVLALQDKLLQVGISEVDSLLDHAGRS